VNRRPARSEPAVVVIGGGPGGATAAQLLAAWGWPVLLLHRAPSRSLAESLPSSARKLLGFLGQLRAVESAVFQPNDGNIVRWAARADSTTTTAEGFHVDRAAFDRVLRGCAAAAGATIVDAVVRGVELGKPPSPPLVEYVTADGVRTVVRPRFVLDCSGRAGVLARRGFRREEAGYRTLAISAQWTSDGWPSDERTRTIIESFGGGWAWSVPLSDSIRQCTVMIDPGRAMRGGGHARALQMAYSRELHHARDLHARLSAGTQTSAAWACDSSLYHAPEPAAANALLVGDAASFIEPLSSAGVKKALVSGWRAAVVTNTCLSKPDMASTARDFFVGRERDVYAECFRRSSRFFAEAAAVYGDPFWTERSAAAADPDTSVDDVRRAFDRLRTASRVRISDDVRFEAVAEVDGREIVLREAIAAPGFEMPLRFTGGVNVPALVRLAVECPDVSNLVAAYQARIGGAPVDAVVAGLSLLVARRALIPEDLHP
jgi:flavin-dependent dehydrogenase